MKRIIGIISVLIVFISFSVHAVSEAPKPVVKVGVLKWGTANWELQTLVKKKLDIPYLIDQHLLEKDNV